MSLGVTPSASARKVVLDVTPEELEVISRVAGQLDGVAWYSDPDLDEITEM